MTNSTEPADLKLPEAARIVVEVLTSAFGGEPDALTEHPGMMSLQQALPRLFGAFPDLSASCQQVLTDGDRVATHWILRGTHTGPVFGIAPTGKAVEFQNVSIARVEAGRIVQFNSEAGWLRVFMQLGVLPLSPSGSPPPPIA